MKFGAVPVGEVEGAILAHSITVGAQTWRKGRILSADDVRQLQSAGMTEVVVASKAPDDLDENKAAELIAAALVSQGIEARPASTGRVNLHAVVSGVFTVDRGVVDALNRIDPAITLATLPDFSTVEAGQMVATVKIIPFAVAEPLGRQAITLASRDLPIKLHPFQPRRVGLVQTVLPSIKKSVLDRTAERTADRLARSGSILAEEIRVSHETPTVAEAAKALAARHDMVLIFGASAVADADDVIPAAIRREGRVERVGMPVDPGNLLVLGEIASRPVIGAPGCARSPKLNGFDWVLDRLMAGLPVSDREISGMGVGGLLMEIESRPQPREPKPARSLSVAAVILAAGKGERMGGPNKLLALFDGVPLVSHIADCVAAAKVRTLVLVAGHQADRVTVALGDAPVRIVVNDHYTTGLASSLKAGIGALPPDIAGAMIVLADMPRVSTTDLDRLVDAFVKAGGRSIVRATHAGKRGNPVILPRSLFPAVAKLEGDTGARHLVEGSDLPVIEVEIGEAASLDVDTPEAMALAGGVLEG